MDYYNIVIIVLLVLLVIALLVYGLTFKSINPIKFPESQDNCPTQWQNIDGICMNPTSSDCSGICNKLASIPSGTPGFNGTNGIDPTNPGWASYSGASNSSCGKKKWAQENNIQWNGINTYQC
jgi:hypothetical protein